MDRRFERSFDEMMDQAEVSPELLRGLLPLAPIAGIRLSRTFDDPGPRAELAPLVPWGFSLAPSRKRAAFIGESQ
jgi:hypothetical protein